jgi:ATP-dependent Clp protease adapter protein ClpS
MQELAPEKTIKLVIEKEEKKEPSKQYGLILKNSDYTEYGCVVKCLEISLSIGESGAKELTKLVHDQGSVLIGTWNKDVAETKASLSYDILCKLHEEKGLDEPSTIFSVEQM